MVTGVARNHGYLEGVGSIRLHYLTWELPASRAGVIVVHGLSDHAARFTELAERLADLGTSVFALDLRGHGQSEGRRGHVQRFDIFLQDLDRFRRQVQNLLGVDKPLFLLGHSLGGLIALRYLEEYETGLRGGIISSPWLATAHPVPRWKAMLVPFLNALAPALPIRAGIPAAHLSHREEIVQAYRDDPLVHDRITPRLFLEAATAMGLVFQRADRIRVPLLLLVAGDDRLVSTQRTLALTRSLGVADTTIRVFPGMYHEVLNEPERDIVYDQVRTWIAERLT